MTFGFVIFLNLLLFCIASYVEMFNNCLSRDVLTKNSQFRLFNLYTPRKKRFWHRASVPKSYLSLDFILPSPIIALFFFFPASSPIKLLEIGLLHFLLHL